MTAETLQDALTLLPSDLVTATDRLRSAPKSRVILWKRLVPIAACLVLLLSVGLVMHQVTGRSKADSTAEAPAAMAPAQMESAADMAAPQEAPAADVEAPAEHDAMTKEESAAPEGDHRHSFAEDTETGASGSWCGNTQVSITMDGQVYTLAGNDAIALANILVNLDYDPDAVCRCEKQFTVDTEQLTGIEVSLGSAFARCELGQAGLTEGQVTAIRAIVEELQ